MPCGWQALRRTLACDVPRPDWEPPGGLTEKESEEAAKTFDAMMVRGWSQLLIEAVGVRNTWERAASGEVGRRQRAEDSREIVRTLLRAWREVVDDVRAGAAKWNQRWKQQALLLKI